MRRLKFIIILLKMSKEIFMSGIQNLLGHVPVNQLAIPKFKRQFLELYISIDEQTHVSTSELATKLIERHICCVCLGVVKLPAISCLKCSQVVCSSPCFEKIEPKGKQFPNKSCPFMCKNKMNSSIMVSLFVREAIKQ